MDIKWGILFANILGNLKKWRKFMAIFHSGKRKLIQIPMPLVEKNVEEGACRYGKILTGKPRVLRTR